jgi:hypothetical protein
LGIKQQTLVEEFSTGGQPASLSGRSKEAGFSSTQNLDFQEYNQTAEDKGDFESSVSTLDTGYEKSWVEEEVTLNKWGYREK